jgi:hypothetical protein
LHQTPENGMRVSPAALTVLGEWQQLEHLIWRGQAALLWPLIDELRLSICEELTRAYGSNWPLEWNSPVSEEVSQAVNNDPMATEWGHLLNAVRNGRNHREHHRLGLITLAWRLRNQLAHYKPVSFQEYESLVAQLR